MIEDNYKRKLTAILSADAVGYSRLMGEDEAQTVHAIKASRQIFYDTINQYGGRVIDSPGDNLLAEFASVIDAMRCAWDVQKELGARNAALSANRQLPFRIGINLGDVIEQDGRIYGEGVNIAARLESMAEPGGILLSRTVYDQVKHKLSYRFEYIGERHAKNIQDPVRVYRVVMGSDSLITPQRTPVANRAFSIKATIALFLAVAIVAAVGVFFMKKIREATFHGKIKPGVTAHHPLSQKASIAVLPFKNLSGDTDHEYFSDGITNDIITDLSRFSELLVIASNTVFTYKGKTVNSRTVGQELGVRYVLEGSVQKAGDRVRINAQLINAIDGTHIWAERYNRMFEDIFTLQGDLVQAIVSTLTIKTFQYEQARAMRMQPQDLQAYDYLLRGYAFLNQRNREAYTLASDMFSKAIEVDPHYAAAYVGLGYIEYGKVSYGWTEFPDKALARAFMFGKKALTLNESNAAAHSLLSSVYTFRNEHDLAVKEARLAIDLNPNDSGSYNELGWALLWSGQVDQAIEALEMSLRLDSSSPRNIWLHLGIAYYLKEKYEKALHTLEAGLINRPDFAGYHIALAATHAQLGDTQKAARASAAVLRLDPFFEIETFGTGFRQPEHRQAIAAGLRKAGLQ